MICAQIASAFYCLKYTAENEATQNVPDLLLVKMPKELQTVETIIRNSSKTQLFFNATPDFHGLVFARNQPVRLYLSKQTCESESIVIVQLERNLIQRRVR